MIKDLFTFSGTPGGGVRKNIVCSTVDVLYLSTPLVTPKPLLYSHAI
jgi:hypothetical protein